MKRRAYSSREMLNLIVIIGVVMAFLMPFIMTKINNDLINQRFKKAYTTIFTAITSSESGNDTRYACFYNPDNLPQKMNCKEYDSNNTCTQWVDENGETIDEREFSNLEECDKLTSAISEYIRISERCNSNAAKKGCIPKYKGVDTVYKLYADKISFEEKNANKIMDGCRKWTQENIANNSASWVLSDGTIILFYGDKPDFSLFAIDVNGKTGPNKWGHDIFAFYLKSVNNSALFLSSGICDITDKNGVSVDEMRSR